MASFFYNSFWFDASTGGFDPDAVSYKIALVTSSYTPNKDTHTSYVTHVTNEVANGNGYTTGGKPILISITRNDASSTIDFRFSDTGGADVLWPASTITAAGAVIYVTTTNQLVAYLDFGGSKSSSNATFSVSQTTIGFDNPSSGSDFIYQEFWQKVFTGVIDLNSVTYKMLLVTGAPPAKTGTGKFRDLITNEAAVGGGYSTGGIASGVSVTNDTANDQLDVTWGTSSGTQPHVWSNSSISASGAVIYVSRGGAATADELVGYRSFGGTLTSTSADFSVGVCSYSFTNNSV